MSLNIIPAGSSPSTPPLLPGESLLTFGNTADLELRIPATIQGPKRTETAKGRVWLTDQRVIFLSASPDTASASAPPSYDVSEGVQSLVIPYSTLLASTFHLPTFSPNNILLAFLPDPSSGLAPTLPSPGRGGKIEAKLVVGEGAGHGMWKRIEGERGKWVERARAAREEALPLYTPN